MTKTKAVVKRTAAERAAVKAKREKTKEALLKKIHTDRLAESQELGWHLRPLCICPLPAKPLPKRTVLLGNGKKESEHETLWSRKAGKYLVEIQGHKKYGIPYGQDILIILYLAIEAKRQNSRTIKVNFYRDFMRMFGMNANSGHKYNMVKQSIYRIRRSTFFWEDITKPKSRDHGGGFLYIDDYDLFFNPKNPDQISLFDQYIMISEQFWNEINWFEIPINLEAVRLLKHKPAHLNFYIWLSYRVWYAYHCENGKTEINFWGNNGLQLQTSSQISERRYYRREVGNYLDSVKEVWPLCPVRVGKDKLYIEIDSPEKLDIQEKPSQRLLDFKPPALTPPQREAPADQETDQEAKTDPPKKKEKATTTKKKSPFENELKKYGVKGGGLKKVLALPEEQIKRNFEYAKQYLERMKKTGTPVPNTGGLVYAAIIGDYAEKSPLAQEQEQKKKAVQDEREKQDAEHEEIRKLQKQFATARWKKIEKRLNDLPAAEREKMDAAIEDFFLQGKYAEQYKKEKFKDPLIRSLFFTAFAEELNLTEQDINFKKHMAAIGQPVTEDHDCWKFEQRDA